MRSSLVRKLSGLHIRCLKRPSVHSTRRSLHQLSIEVSGTPSKDAVIDSLKRQLEPSGHDGQISQSATAVILASPEFASWSEDQGFMSHLLATLQRQRQGDSSTTWAAGESHLDVLFGVTDGIATQHRLLDGKPPHQGLSILYGGTASLLPSLWEQGRGGGGAIAGNLDKASSVIFTNGSSTRSQQLASPTTTAATTQVTLPLANTLFQNGRRSTLFASRWSSSSSSSSAEDHYRMELKQMEEKSQQEIACLKWGFNGAVSLRIPLMPLAPPRKIAAGLGNIVRQVEIDGAASPASKELEMLIPQMLEKRAVRGDRERAPSPVGVWAWVIPARLVETELQRLVAATRTYQSHPDEEEARLVVDARNMYQKLLLNGCRMHKILSGGGGWGAKQGLLSLDPETAYAAPEQDDIDMFIKAFEERNSAKQSSEGIVTPGSYILFCAEAQHNNNSISSYFSEPSASSSFSLAVAPKNEEPLLSLDGTGMKRDDRVKVLPGHFGVASSTGLYLSRESGSATKIDAPYSALSWY